ncbi:MAG TPA: TetR family transcriptional regulator [Polyangiaceae bacterium]|nr:TetR family transcriptional regulator [Polyangiaceae bacterium]
MSDARRQLLSATITVLAKCGPAEASIKRIAEEAGVNHGLVHHYFGSKQRLLIEALDALDESLTEQVADIGSKNEAAVFVRTRFLEDPVITRVLAALITLSVESPELRTALHLRLERRARAVANLLNVSVEQAHALIAASLGAAELSRVHPEIDPTRVTRALLGVGVPRAQ